MPADDLLPPLETLETREPLEAGRSSSLTVAEVAASAKPSLVTIHAVNRDGNERGLGTGFVIPGDLIVTNLHVTGEGRDFRVEDARGQPVKIVEVVAWDRVDDLVVLRADWQGRALPPLELAPDFSLATGAPIVVMGNPLGLKHSVVSGVLSGQREVESRRMLQLAIPVEPGNSGGPVLDRQGRVHGVVTMKSLLTDNLGFAIQVSSLRTLLQRRNTIPLDKWRHVGQLDASIWEPLQANWRQRAATLHVEGVGPGFGGRTQCLLKQEPPALPYEVAVHVKLGDEAGAAGLVFHADGKDRHYGFYPSNGRLRLTCFLGSSVYSWKVLHNEATPHYASGEWNRLKVRVEKERVLCYVNDQLVVTLNDLQLHAGRVGLAKFRDTTADFRHFQLAPQLASKGVTDDQQRELAQQVDGLGSLSEVLSDDLQSLARSPDLAARLLAERATALERQAAELRRLQEQVRVEAVCRDLRRLVADAGRDGEPEMDLGHAALLLARLDDSELDVEAYREWLTQLGQRLRASLPADADESQKLRRLDEFVFQDNAFQGSHHEYYHRANSHLHRVLEDREGLPITLSVLYMTLGRAIDLPLEGVGLPGHFVVRYRPREGEPVLIDVFHGGRRLDRAATVKLVAERAGVRLNDQHLAPVAAPAILDRMLRNLLGVAQRDEDKPAMLRYLEALVALDPNSVSDRGMRAVLRFENGRKAAALADLDWILQRDPPGLDLRRVQQMRDQFQQRDPPVAR
ncbi:MAG: tetratricopeptide repeat protein [Planctomycetales bacterium]|nr:tetratricopeptide repeat protein [Planctomycetales bacterium]